MLRNKRAAHSSVSVADEWVKEEKTVLAAVSQIVAYILIAYAAYRLGSGYFWGACRNRPRHDPRIYRKFSPSTFAATMIEPGLLQELQKLPAVCRTTRRDEAGTRYCTGRKQVLRVKLALKWDPSRRNAPGKHVNSLMLTIGLNPRNTMQRSQSHIGRGILSVNGKGGCLPEPDLCRQRPGSQDGLNRPGRANGCCSNPSAPADCRICCMFTATSDRVATAARSVSLVWPALPRQRRGRNRPGQARLPNRCCQSCSNDLSAPIPAPRGP